MSISGPLGRQEDLDTSAVGTPQRTGNDSYSAEILLQGGNNSDTYICFSSNIVSNSSSSSYLKVSSNPIILSVKQKSAKSVIVEWSQPSGGATVTAYVVHYSDGVDKMTEDVPAPSTSSSITNLTNCLEYTFIVEAISEHLSGESDIHTIALGASALAVDIRPEAMSSTSIIVRWTGMAACNSTSQIVKYRVKYKAESSGMPHNTVNETREEISLTGLVPYTLYSVEVAAMNEEGEFVPYCPSITVETFEDIPGPVGAVMASPSLSQVTLTWEPPLMPNGIIIAYEVSYRQTASSEPETRVNSSALATNFTTESNLEEATEFIFSVRAYTRVGPGNATSLTVATLGAESIPTLRKTAAILGIGSGVALIGIVTFGIAISWTVFKRSHRRAKPRMYTEDNPAYGVTLGVRYKPSRRTDSSPTHTQEPVYDTIS
ncbi:Protein sidekick-2 [Geodia barretti]|nr:Protein sidekick-2 [Geodia barretti]